MREEELLAMLEKKAQEFVNKDITARVCGTDIQDPTKVLLYADMSRMGETAHIEVTFSKKGKEYTPKYWSIKNQQIPMPMQMVGKITLGKDVCVSDPCYDRKVWCMTQLHNVKTGRWNVWASVDELDSWGKRTYLLILKHENVTAEEESKFIWEDCATLGVDSGTMSVIDDTYYRRKNGSAEAFEADDSAKEEFSDLCLSIHNQYVGLFRTDNVAVGVICSSGIGDGAYPLRVVKKDGEIIAMEVSFM